MLYSLLKILFRIALKVYFKKIEIEGLENVPKDGPIIVSPNHQNAFLDAFLVGAFIPVPLHFLTRSDVFTWWNRPLMKIINMMPIYRIRDGYDKLTQNDAIFKTCEELFRQKKSVVIFAEGNHGEHHYLRPLTKGTARLALQAQTAIKEDLNIVPVGLNYFNHKKANSKVILVFGSPIPVSPFVSQYAEFSGKGLNSMRDAVSDGMKSTLVIPNKTNDYEVIKKTVFRKENEHLSFLKLRSLNPDPDIKVIEKPFNHLIAKIFNPLPFFLIWKVISGVEDVVFHSSIKFSIGLIMFPIWWSASFFIFKAQIGIISASIIVFFMIASLLVSYKWLR